MRVMTALTRLVVGMSRFGDHLLSRKASGIIVAALAFFCGAGLAYALGREPRPKQVTPTAAPADCSSTGAYAAPPPVVDYTPADEFEWGDPDALQAWKEAHGGAPLPANGSNADWSKVQDSKVVILPSGRTLVGADDTLYMLDAGRRVLWRRDVPQWLIDFAYVGATDTVYATAGDNNLLILEGATGRRLHGESRNGRAGFGRVLPYGEDACLVMDAYGGYREGYAGGEPTRDGVTAWRGTRMLWHAEVPPDAELQVVGSKIYAVTKTKSRILVREIEVPKH